MVAGFLLCEMSVLEALGTSVKLIMIVAVKDSRCCSETC